MARKNRSGPHRYLPLLLQGAGSCSCFPKAVRALEKAQGSNTRLYKAQDLTVVGLQGNRVLKADLWSRGKFARVNKLSGYVLGHQLGGSVAKWNPELQPCPFNTSVTTNNNDSGDF